MKKGKKLLTALAFVFLIHSTCFSQSSDFRIRTKAGVKFNIIEKLSNTSELELRTKDNSSNIDVFRFNTSFGYKFHKNFNMAVGYALIFKPISEPTSLITSHRYWVDASGNLSHANFTFSIRERFQQTFAINESVILLRSEIKAQYAIPNSIFKPYISCEPHLFLFNQLKGLKEVRYEVGTTVAINKHNDLQMYGRYARNYNQILTPNHWVLGLNYYYKF
jgi:hypothetical protein